MREIIDGSVSMDEKGGCDERYFRGVNVERRGAQGSADDFFIIIIPFSLLLLRAENALR